MQGRIVRPPSFRQRLLGETRLEQKLRIRNSGSGNQDQEIRIRKSGSRAAGQFDAPFLGPGRYEFVKASGHFPSGSLSLHRILAGSRALGLRPALTASRLSLPPPGENPASIRSSIWIHGFKEFAEGEHSIKMCIQEPLSLCSAGCERLFDRLRANALPLLEGNPVGRAEFVAAHSIGRRDDPSNVG